MYPKNELKFIDAVILCGGLGTRIKSVAGNKPKALLEIGNRTMLDLIINGLTKAGLQRIILSVGYLKDQIKKYPFNLPKYVTVEFSEEDYPLGTGGALKKAEFLLKSQNFLVLNGDSICRIDLNNFLEFHLTRRALLSIALSHSEKLSEGGHVIISRSKRIKSFNEKPHIDSGGFINAGAYFMNRDIFLKMPSKNVFSLEKDFFSNIIRQNCYGFVVKSKVIDIGTPKRYARAVKIL
ncbi:NTP transferase domain-containing protein [Candidatus Daviesbacteria bacterium]|nr:NTP transferase domain-containing protein [Candidatus Daviesbacteria bacterium]